MTPHQRRARNAAIVMWLAVGLLGCAFTSRADVWALSYAVGSAAVYYGQRRGWL